MRADIVAGAVFPDYELTDHAGQRRWLLDQLVKENTANRPAAVLASKQLVQLLGRLNVECLAVREICSIVHDVATRGSA